MGFEELHAIPPALCAHCFRMVAALSGLGRIRIDPDHFARECALHRQNPSSFHRRVDQGQGTDPLADGKSPAQLGVGDQDSRLSLDRMSL